MKNQNIVKTAVMGLVLLGLIGVGNMAFALDYSIQQTKAFNIPKGSCVHGGVSKEGQFLGLDYPACYDKQDTQGKCIVFIKKGSFGISTESDIKTLSKKGDKEDPKGFRDFVHVSNGTTIQFDCMEDGKVFANIREETVISSGIRPDATWYPGDGKGWISFNEDPSFK